MFKNEEGFSLLELVVAVGVAGIIAAVALPTFAGLQDKATTTSATYAASASAAEALANSTIGNTGGNGSASTTGGSSSSAAASSSSYTGPAFNTDSTIYPVGMYYGMNWTVGNYSQASTWNLQAGDRIRISGYDVSRYNNVLDINGIYTIDYITADGAMSQELASKLSGISQMWASSFYNFTLEIDKA